MSKGTTTSITTRYALDIKYSPHRLQVSGGRRKDGGHKTIELEPAQLGDIALIGDVSVIDAVNPEWEQSQDVGQSIALPA